MTCTGRALAQVLEGCWRPDAAPLEMEPAQLEALAPLLAESGAGALAWRRLRPSAGAARPAGSAGAARPAAAEALLHGAHIRQALEARLREQEIESTLLLLQEHGVEPLLVKGWDCARLYPELGLRPFGDVDLLVLPEQARLACELLGVQIDRPVGHLLDLKSRLPAMYGLSLPSMLSLARRVELGRAWAQVPCAEDQLRLLCLHFLRHGAWRPLWLCDIAAALEARPAGFSWPRCLSLDKRRAERVACALSLAHLLLGARLDNTPLQRQAHALPSWLVPAVLKEWAAPQLSRHALPAPLSLAPRRAGPHPGSARALAQPHRGRDRGAPSAEPAPAARPGHLLRGHRAALFATIRAPSALNRERLKSPQVLEADACLFCYAAFARSRFALPPAAGVGRRAS